MRKITPTGFESIAHEDRPALYISTGQGNRAGVPEVFIQYVDEAAGHDIHIGWFKRDELIAALLDPDPEPQRLGRAGVQA